VKSVEIERSEDNSWFVSGLWDVIVLKGQKAEEVLEWASEDYDSNDPIVAALNSCRITEIEELRNYTEASTARLLQEGTLKGVFDIKELSDKDEIHLRVNTKKSKFMDTIVLEEADPEEDYDDSFDSY
jgi:hypothetical protein